MLVQAPLPKRLAAFRSGRLRCWPAPQFAGEYASDRENRLADEAPLCNLDDPVQLKRLRLKPSEVVSRDYSRTRAWARRIYE